MVWFHGLLHVDGTRVKKFQGPASGFCKARLMRARGKAKVCVCLYFCVCLCVCAMCASACRPLRRSDEVAQWQMVWSRSFFNLSCTGFMIISTTYISNTHKETVIACLKHSVICVFQVKLWNVGCWNWCKTTHTCILLFNILDWLVYMQHSMCVYIYIYIHTYT